jgi:hypothetical protein
MAFIGGLDKTKPEPTDNINQADDEIRGIKDAIVNTFTQGNKPLNIDFGDINKLYEVVKFDNEHLNLPGYEFDALNPDKKLHVDETGKIVSLPPLPPIGSILKTPLTFAQVNSYYGEGIFRLLNGGAIGLDERLFGELLLGVYPDIYESQIDEEEDNYGRTTFFRQCKTDQIIGAYLPDQSSPNGLDAATETSSDSHTHDVTAHRHIYRTPLNNAHGSPWDGSGARVTSNVYHQSGFESSDYFNEAGEEGEKLFKVHGHRHEMEYIGFDAETRPKNMHINCYLRIR